MTTKLLKNEDSITGLLDKSKAEISDPLYEIAKDTDHRRLREAVKRHKEDIAQTRQQTEHKSDELAEYIMRCLKAAQAHKRKICEEYNQREALRLRKGVYTEMELALLGGSKTAAWFPITDRLCRGLSAFLRNIMTRDDENPNWDIQATPIPELPKADADAAAQSLAQTVIDQLTLGFKITEQDITAELDRIADSLIKELRDEAARKAMKMTDYIRDLLEEANWRDVFDELLDDAVTFGTGIIKAPYITAGWDQTYNGTDKIQQKKRKSSALRTLTRRGFSHPLIQRPRRTAPTFSI